MVAVAARGFRSRARVQEGHSRLDAPRHRALVRAQAVVDIELRDLVDEFRMELLLVGGLVEVQITGQNLVGALAGEDLC